MTPRELLEQVKQRILADPKSYMQTSFCGTQCCIAGHIDAIINGAEFHNTRITRQTFASAIEEIERLDNDALGETDPPWLFGTINARDARDKRISVAEGEAYVLEKEAHVRESSYMRYELTLDGEGRVKVGCKAIDRYLEERGV